MAKHAYEPNRKELLEQYDQISGRLHKLEALLGVMMWATGESDHKSALSQDVLQDYAWAMQDFVQQISRDFKTMCVQLQVINQD